MIKNYVKRALIQRYLPTTGCRYEFSEEQDTEKKQTRLRYTYEEQQDINRQKQSNFLLRRILINYYRYKPNKAEMIKKINQYFNPKKQKAEEAIPETQEGEEGQEGQKPIVKFSRISRTSKQKIFRDFVHEKKIFKFKRDYIFSNKIRPYKPTKDDIIDQMQKELHGQKFINNPNLFDKFKQRYRDYENNNLTNLIMRYDNFQPSLVYEQLRSHFTSGLYGFLKEEQFQQFFNIYKNRTLIFHRPSFQIYLNKLPEQFFLQYSKYINTDNITQIIKEVEGKNYKFLPILRYCELKNKAYYFELQENFDQFLQKVPDQDQLLIQYFFFHENNSKLLNYESFLKGILNIQWGGQVNQEPLKQQLVTLLNVKFKINLNRELQLYLADLFFGCDSFDKAIVAIALQYLLLQRLTHAFPIKDILECFKQTLGEERFTFYLQQELPQILQNLNIKTYYSSFQKGLIEYQQHKSKKSLTIQNYTNLDGIFLKGKYIEVSQFQILYNPSSTNLMYTNQTIAYDVKENAVKEAVLNNSTLILEKELSNLFSYKEYKWNIVDMAHRLVYRKKIMNRNFLRYNLTKHYLQRKRKLRKYRLRQDIQKELYDLQTNLRQHQKIQPLLQTISPIQTEKAPAEEVQEKPQETQETKEAQEATSEEQPQEKTLEEEIFSFAEERQQYNQLRLARVKTFTKISKMLHTLIIQNRPMIKEYRQKQFVQKPKYHFCTQKFEEIPKDEGTGFMNYLKSVESIDLEVKQQEELNQIQQQRRQPQSRKHGKILLERGEAQQLKSIFSEDSENLIRIRQEQKKQSDMFQKLEQPQRFRRTKASDTNEVVHKMPFENAEKEKQNIPQLQEQYVIDNILYNTNLSAKAHFQITQLFQENQTRQQLVEDVQNFLSGIKQSQDGYHFYLISELISALETKRPLESKIIFTQIICQVKNKIEVNEKIKVKYTTQYGDIEKNYGKYINQTCTQFSLGSKGYNYILDFILQEGNYNRLLYKRTLAHYCLNETVLYDSTFEKITQITKNNKIPQTCAEFFYAFLSTKITINFTQMRKIVNLLYQFKHFEAEAEQLIIGFYFAYQWQLKFEELQPIFQRLINQNKRDRYMSLYESLKDQLMGRKLRQIPTQDPVEVNKIMTEYKQQQKDQLKEFVRKFSQLLLDSKLPDDARLVINDAKRFRYQYEIFDYRLWLLSHVNHFEDALKIWADYGVKFPNVYDITMFKAFLSLLQQQETAHESDDTKALFQDVIRIYIFEKKITLDHDLIFDITHTYKRLKEFTSYQNFMKFLLEIRYKCIPSHKYLFYKMMNFAEVDSVKETIKGIIDILFKDEQRKKDGKQKQNKKEEEVNYDLGNKGPNPLHIQDLTKENKLNNKKKRGILVRGGKSKFTQIETDGIADKNKEEDGKTTTKDGKTTKDAKATKE
ncbi:unnamed protein product (macronuclear) [Paramecium tetraurelia]|uniref:Uncharacterized protein n=1 Tax=Paramecium tetraurelia TaxID=5888 RepID=A0BUG9_PARTE|nr:uncharacterized protein GSPATT00032418001 [Paramecium tetraurelia]CAK62186.1 unnamed protein product [Paramecium tetraurelia]|eukprot:XP_001429584.1 hypothetical protein (macronuclear) [Paramecium tetraurelia strain d4-2]